MRRNRLSGHRPIGGANSTDDIGEAVAHSGGPILSASALIYTQLVPPIAILEEGCARPWVVLRAVT